MPFPRPSLAISIAITAGALVTVARAQVDSIDGDIGATNANSGDVSSGVAAQSANATASQREQLAVASGAWAVSPSGGFTYTLPLETVPGRGGVEPDLSLVYDSHNSNGMLGYGWTLRGLPAVIRIPHGRGLRFDGGDQFAVNYDGWGTPTSPTGRLVRLADGTYHTVVESNQQFHARGTCDQGECFWEMKDGGGRTHHFGGAPTARLLERDAGMGRSRGGQAWALTSVRDLDGNGYRVAYEQDAWMMYPKRIEVDCSGVAPATPTWIPSIPAPVPDDGTGVTLPVPGTRPTLPWLVAAMPLPLPGLVPINPGTGSVSWTPSTSDLITGSCASGQVRRQIEFEWDTSRVDRPMAPAQYARRLQRIVVKVDGRQVRAYAFAYAPSTDGQSRLSTITPQGTSTTATLPPMTLRWTVEPTPRFAAMTTRAATGAGAVVETHTGDVNGDGFSDVVRVRLGDNLSVGTWLGSATGLAESPQTQQQGPMTFSIDGTDEPARSYHTWSSLVADVTGDGLDDVVVWSADNARAFMLIAAGRAGSAPGPLTPYAHGGELFKFARDTVGARPMSTYRMLPGDFDGDQLGDLVLVNNETMQMALLRGAPGGPTAPQVRRNGFALPAFRWKNEPVVADVNGDGVSDVVLSNEHGAGFRAVYALGSASGLGSAGELTFSAGPASPAAFQVAAGDVNGDGADDLTLAWSGPRLSFAGGGIPFARDVRTLFGSSEFTAGRTTARAQVAAVSVAPPGPDYAANRLGYWQHHAADVNCDGLTDLVAYYGGAGGQQLEWMLGRGDGTFAPATTSIALNGLAAASGMPSPDPALTADGGRQVHRWQSRVADLDRDGCTDVIRYYAGRHGVRVDVVHGSPRGLGPAWTARFGSTTAVTESASATDLSRQRSLDLQTADLDGDGKLDLIVATYDQLVVVPSTGAQPNLVDRVSNGLGGTVTVTYAPAARVTGAIAATATTCPAGADCGAPFTSSRPLVTQVATDDGRGASALRESVRFGYRDGRYFAGPLSGLFPVSGRHTRADLGFASRTVTDGTTGVVTTTTMRRDWPFHGEPSSIERRSSTSALIDRTATTYYDNLAGGELTTAYGTQRIRPKTSTTTTYEGGAIDRTATTSWEYDAHGFTTRTRLDEGPGLVRDEHVGYAHDDARWVLGRITSSKQRAAIGESVTAWNRYHYTGDRVDRVEELVFPGTSSPCFTTDAACLSAGARWVAVERDHAYDPFGNLTGVTDALGRRTTSTYDTAFATYRTSRTRALGAALIAGGSVGTAPPDATFLGGTLADVLATAPVELTERWTHDDAGRVLTATDVGGRVTTTTYDALGRVDTVLAPDGGRTRHVYTSFGSPTAQHIETWTQSATVAGVAVESWARTYFDGFGQVYELRRGRDAGVYEVTRRERYLAGGRRVDLASNPALSTDAAADVVWTVTERDERDRPVAIKRRRAATRAGGGTDHGTATTWSYQPGVTVVATNAGGLDASGRFTSDRWRWTRHHYDGRGRVWRIVDAAGAGTLYVHDDADRIALIAGPDPALAAATLTTGGLSLCVTYRCASFERDSRGRVVAHTEPETGTATSMYDDGDHLLARTDALGVTTSWAYDGVDRPLWRLTPDGVTSYTYDVAVPGAIGTLVSVAYPGGHEDVQSVDAAGRVTARSISRDALNDRQGFSYRYDLGGRPTRVELPDRTVIEYTYAHNYLRSVLVDGGEVARYEDRRGDGQVGRRVSPPGTTVYGYGIDGVLDTTRATTSSGAQLLAYDYAHDAQGNIRAVTDVRTDRSHPYLDGLTGVTRYRDTTDTWSYDYDALDRVTSAAFRGGAAELYGYDARGNLITRGQRRYVRQPGFASMAYQPPHIPCVAPVGQPLPPNCTPSPPLPQVQLTATYDDAGRLVSRTRYGVYPTVTATRELAYDALGRLTAVRDEGKDVVTLGYGADTDRARKTALVGGREIITHYLTPYYELRESSAAPGSYTATRHAITPDGERIASITGTSGWSPLTTVLRAAFTGTTADGVAAGGRYYFGNHLGSVAVVTDRGGAVESRFLHDPWGTLLRDASAGFDETAHKFAREESDAETGYVDFGARVYDPELAQFLTADSVIPGGGADPQGLNRYAYVLNNPLRYIDPTGHEPEPGIGVVNRSELKGLIDSQVLSTDNISVELDIYFAALGVEVDDAKLQQLTAQLLNVGTVHDKTNGVAIKVVRYDRTLVTPGRTDQIIARTGVEKGSEGAATQDNEVAAEAALGVEGGVENSVEGKAGPLGSVGHKSRFNGNAKLEVSGGKKESNRTASTDKNTTSVEKTSTVSTGRLEVATVGLRIEDRIGRQVNLRALGTQSAPLIAVPASTTTGTLPQPRVPPPGGPR